MSPALKDAPVESDFAAETHELVDKLLSPTAHENIKRAFAEKIAPALRAAFTAGQQAAPQPEDDMEFYKAELASEEAATLKLHKHIVALEAVLRDCRDTFMRYEDHHRRKDTPESWMKALANLDMARRCEAALTPTSGAADGKEEVALAAALVQQKAHVNNLLARIFRDGGQRQAEFATTTEAVEAADKLCADYIAALAQRDAEVARLTDERDKAQSDAENAVWNLAGCSTYALGYNLDEGHNMEMARPALNEVRELALKHRAAETEVARAVYKASRWKTVADNKYSIDDLAKYQERTEVAEAALIALREQKAKPNDAELLDAYQAVSEENARLRGHLLAACSRLCRHCHEGIPLDDTGKWHVKDERGVTCAASRERAALTPTASGAAADGEED